MPNNFLDWIHGLYEQGYFPMAGDDGRIDWYSVSQRALFPISGIHVSKSLAKTLRGGEFRVTFDECFGQVMRNCRRPKDNWINEELIQWYEVIHAAGWAHSCEVWAGEELVGGVYGVAIGACFNAESMFHRRTDASKVALWAMVNRCRELGFQVFDAQIMNPHLESLGAYEVPAREYSRLLRQSLTCSTEWSR
ncbi:MAG: leucyl/phenylalanyl-tRNA--protein transferase [Armatimonadetes bacterium]|nr:leucyl/phenylalanyl-tRNA--protein transferase [Armatimonadota bacterium]